MEVECFEQHFSGRAAAKHVNRTDIGRVVHRASEMALVEVVTGGLELSGGLEDLAYAMGVPGHGTHLGVQCGEG